MVGHYFIRLVALLIRAIQANILGQSNVPFLYRHLKNHWILSCQDRRKLNFARPPGFLELSVVPSTGTLLADDEFACRAFLITPTGLSITTSPG